MSFDSLPSSLSMIHSMLPAELIIYCISFCTSPANLLASLNKQRECMRVQRECIVRRAICQRWRGFFEQSTSYVVSSSGQLDRLVELLIEDPERGSRAKRISITRFEFLTTGSAPVVRTGPLVTVAPNLEELDVAPRLSSRDEGLLEGLGSLQQLKKIDICIEDIAEDALARYVYWLCSHDFVDQSIILPWHGRLISSWTHLEELRFGGRIQASVEPRQCPCSHFIRHVH